MARSLGNAGKVALLVVATILVCIAAVELVVRVRYGDKFGPRPGFYTADNILGWKPAPDLDHVFYGPDFQIAIRTDADGYRLGTAGEVDYSKELVVLCGDSYAFGWGVATDQSFASYLDTMLTARSSGALRVVNLGVGGYGTFQNCDRLAGFFRKHPAAKPRLILVQHSVNDVTDNYRNIGYHLGTWPTETIQKERSRFHVVNLIRYAIEARKKSQTQVAAVGKEPFAQDLLWAFRRTQAVAGIPEELSFEGRVVVFDAATVKKDVSPDSLARRKAFTKVQHDLMLEALHCIHDVAATRGVVVVHTFIATTPEWYVEQVSDLARQSAAFAGCRAIVTEAIPNPGDFTGPIDNPHSGRHFNGDFNRFWATAVVKRLDAMNLLARQ
ncbi:MAG: SGNH/GDSL hydrolase family protein [Candidatus Latescibacteria bacterium]|nr:SGNH/GDSL hydrolase family protein [Candidatus Latescibacterota bacterium]